jgi:hypothetical protein
MQVLRLAERYEVGERLGEGGMGVVEEIWTYFAFGTGCFTSASRSTSGGPHLS